jgi:hypothetical protein
MTVKAHIEGNIMLQGIDVVLYREEGDYTYVWKPGGDTVHTYDRNNPVQPDDEPMRLRDDEARALLTALLRHYEGGEDARSLRRDYDAERRRVDAFIDYLTREQ